MENKLTREEIFKKTQLGELVERKSDSREINCPLHNKTVSIDGTCLKLHQNFFGGGTIKLAGEPDYVNYNAVQRCKYAEGIIKDKLVPHLKGIFCSYVKDLK